MDVFFVRKIAKISETYRMHDKDCEINDIDCPKEKNIGGNLMNWDIYCQLANVIDDKPKDTVPGRQKEDPWVRILQALLQEDELAELCLLCTKEFEPVSVIAERGGLDPKDIESKLFTAAVRGVLVVIERNGQDVYKLHGWAPGIAETAVLSEGIDNQLAAELFWETQTNTPAEQFAGMPVGRGIMRAVPIEKSLMAQSEALSFEQLRTYLDNNEVFSCANCECRSTKAMLGDPCEHPYEDTCLQLGEIAEYYIKTGRGKKISREEAEQLLLRAEREGLVHTVFNNEGASKSSFICNCCGCSCANLSWVNRFRTPDFARSNFVAQVNPEKCVACGACVEICNMNAIRLGTSFCSVEAQVPVDAKSPHDHRWTNADINPEWNIKKMVRDQGTSPCKTKCPAHISIQGYIRKAAEGKYDEALKVIKRDNPFPAVCGRICPHSCENECTRARVDEAMAIDDIKKFIADKEQNAEQRFIPEVFEHYTEKVAVISAGPAGMTAAYYLAAQGYPVTVFERNNAPGGMLKFGIPSFRLEKDIIDAEIDVLRQLGVEFKCGVNVGKDVTIPELREQGYRAFYVAIGAQNSRKLNVEGEELIGVQGGIDFLRQVNLGNVASIEGDTVVIGGGNVAVDVARAAIRLGNKNVKMFCLEKDEEMPTVPDEKDEAIAEGIEINNSWGPKRILGENGKVTGVEFMRCVSVFNEEGKFAPVYDENETVIVPCTNVFTAIGQSIAWDGLLDGTKAEVANGRTVKVAEISYQTEEADIFAGGDCAMGPGFTIDAIATGKSGAITIHRFLRGRGLTMRREREYKPFDKDIGDYSGFDRMPRQRPYHASSKEAVETMSDTRATFTEEQLKKEAQRCLGCGVSTVDPNMCIGCGLCATKCEFDAVKLVKHYDTVDAETPADWGMDVYKYMVEREAKIAAKEAEEGIEANDGGGIKASLAFASGIDTDTFKEEE